MTSPVFLLPQPSPIPASLKKKRVLLVDASQAKRDLRAEIMRKLGMDVDCAADFGEARIWWRADLYNLVLIHMENDLGNRDKFCADIRNAMPPQNIAYLVGKPEYLANTPHADEASAIPMDVGPICPEPSEAALTENSGGVSQRWGIMEASRRISEVRSAWNARTKAMRNRPAPLRDLDTRHGRRTASESSILTELQKEEMQ